MAKETTKSKGNRPGIGLKACYINPLTDFGFKRTYGCKPILTATGYSKSFSGLPKSPKCIPVDKIAESTGLSMSKIEKIRKTIG